MPLSVLYDNLKIAVAKICGDGKRERTRAFTELVSHYLFSDGSAARKGQRQRQGRGLVKYARSNFMTPISAAASFDDLNAMLTERCRRGKSNSRSSCRDHWRAAAAILRAGSCPPAEEPCETRADRVSSRRCAHRQYYSAAPMASTIVKSFVDQVVILCGGAEIARHQRSYGLGVFVFNPLHYLALIETKPNALDQAAPLKDWELPETFQHLRHLLEARMGNRGKREFIQVLRLLEAIPKEVVTYAVTEAIRLGAIGFDAVKQIALARIERRPRGSISPPIRTCRRPA